MKKEEVMEYLKKGVPIIHNEWHGTVFMHIKGKTPAVNVKTFNRLRREGIIEQRTDDVVHNEYYLKTTKESNK